MLRKKISTILRFETILNCYSILIMIDTGERKVINSELWHACAGPLVSLPPVGSLVVYFPQGHSEQVCCIFAFDLHCRCMNSWFGFLREHSVTSTLSGRSIDAKGD